MAGIFISDPLTKRIKYDKLAYRTGHKTTLESKGANMNGYPNSALAVWQPNDPVVRNSKPLVIAMLVVDRSSSMAGFDDKPLKGMRDFVIGLQRGPEPERIAVGIVTFADTTTFEVQFKMASEVDPDELQYLPSGCTRLYGTVYDTLYALLSLATMRQTAGLETQVIMTVITDGDDNRSRELLNPCRDLAKEARRRGWELAVFGLGVSGIKIAREMGFTEVAPRGNAADDDVRPVQNQRPAGFDIAADDEDGTEASVLYTLERTHMTVTGFAVADDKSDTEDTDPMSPPNS